MMAQALTGDDLAGEQRVEAGAVVVVSVSARAADTRIEFETDRGEVCCRHVTHVVDVTTLDVLSTTAQVCSTTPSAAVRHLMAQPS